MPVELTNSEVPFEETWIPKKKNTSGTRLNAYRHGLTGQIMVLLPEEDEAYKNLHASLKSAYNPKGVLEEKIVQSICDAEWRLKRVVSYENSFFALDAETARSRVPIDTGNEEVNVAFSQARTFMNRARDFDLLSTYEGRIHRRMLRDIALLEVAQAKRHAEAQAAMETAKKLYKLAKAQSKPYKPEGYFSRTQLEFEFVYSNASVLHEIHREDLLKTAETYAQTNQLTPEQEAA